MAERARPRGKRGNGKSGNAKSGRSGKRSQGSSSGNGASATLFGHNSGSREVYERWLKKIDTAGKAYDKAKATSDARKGELRAMYAGAKDDGCDVDAIKEAISINKRDHLEVVAEFDNVRLVLDILGSPLVRQLDLFRAGERSPEVEARLAGMIAGRMGTTIDDNPHAAGTAYFVEWRDGWNAGQDENRTSFLETNG